MFWTCKKNIIEANVDNVDNVEYIEHTDYQSNHSDKHDVVSLYQTDCSSNENEKKNERLESQITELKRDIGLRFIIQEILIKLCTINQDSQDDITLLKESLKLHSEQEEQHVENFTLLATLLVKYGQTLIKMRKKEKKRHLLYGILIGICGVGIYNLLK